MIEIMAVLLQHGTERILVYRPPEVIGDFVNTLIAELRLVPTSPYRTLLIGDFNIIWTKDLQVMKIHSKYL